MYLGIGLGLTLVCLYSLFLRRTCRCEFGDCNGRLRFPMFKKPFCEKCGRNPSECDVHI
jgi:hypothetical protein